MGQSAALPAIEERLIDGNYGEVFHNGHYQGDFRDFTGRIAIERREIPRAGTNTMVYRRGRITRDGTLRLIKVDSRFENLIINYANTSVEQMRINRGQGVPTFPDTQLSVVLNDPESWGAEQITIFGVKFWEIGLGFTQNDMVERDLPITWQSELMPQAIPRPGNLQGAAAQLGPGDVTTWPAAGRDPNPVI